MNRATPKIRAIALRLIKYEAYVNNGSTIDAAAMFRASEKLRSPLAAISGINGFRSLLSRALALAGEEVRWLRAVHIKGDGSLEGPTNTSQLDTEDIAEGEVVLMAQLLGLLVAFIGKPLTVSLVREAWPKLSLNVLDFDKGN